MKPRPKRHDPKRRRSSRKLAALAATPLLAASTIAATPSTAQAVTTCHEVRIPVRPHAQIAGTLCAPPAATTIEVLVPGGTYTRWYWTETGYTAAANRAGIATLAIDRLSNGKSTQVPVGSNSFTQQGNDVHKLLTWAHSHKWKKIVLGGHSIGSAIAINEASRYHDADALLLTGITHSPHILPLVRTIVGLVRPANAMPQFKDRPIGQLTHARQSDRAAAFGGPDDPPEMTAADFAHRDTVGPIEIVDAAVQIPVNGSKRITAPVLNIVGDHDVNLNCGLGPCTAPARLKAAERPRYGGPYTAMIAANAGHSMNLARSHTQTYTKMNHWVTTTLG